MVEHPPSNAAPAHLQSDDRSAEFELLCLCASVNPSPERGAAIDTSVAHGIDWHVFLQLAQFHGLLPLAARSLAQTRTLPEEIKRALTSAFETNVRRSLWFSSELVRIAICFDTHAIKAVPYKGPTLAEIAYRDVALRNFSDLDLLIDPQDFDRAQRALRELGYQTSEELMPAVEAFWLRNGYERSFDCAAGNNLVELQWALAPRFFAVHLPTPELLRRSRRIRFAGHEISSLSPEDMFLVLCLHAAKHLWMRLLWLCDIAEFARTHPIDYAVVLLRARNLGILRFVLVSLWLANHVLGMEIPLSATNELRTGQPVEILGKQFAARLGRCATYDFESTDYFRWILKLRERRQDQFLFLWRLAWTPGAGDLATCRLPRPLFPLYSGIRVLRLLRKLF